jgi:acylglycerol lipase
VSNHEEGRFPGSAGGEIAWQAWEVEQPRAVVLLVHGYAEHSGRYGHVADRLTASSYAVWTLDHRGHGASDGVPGNVESFATLRRDLTTLRRMAEERHPDVPVFVVAHSLGGLIALDWLLDGGAAGLAGLVLSGAAVDPSVGTRVEKLIAPVLSRLAPNLGVSRLDATEVSRDPAVVAAYDADPHNYRGAIRARTGAETLAAIDRVMPRLRELTLPALVLHGGDDRIASPVGSRLVVEHLGGEDVVSREYEGLFHEIFNEPERDAVLGEVVDWLDRHA